MRRLGIATGGGLASLTLLCLVAAMPAAAQEDGSPLRFLRPWLERQLQGAEPGTGETEPAPAETGADTDTGVAVPQGATDASTPPSAELAAPSAPAAAGEAELPAETGSTDGASAPIDGPVEAATAPPTAPVASTEGAAPPEPAAPAESPLRIAVPAGRSVADTMAAVGPMADDLESLLGRAVEVLPMTSYAAMIDAQTERRIDAGFYTASAFAAAQARCECLEPLAAPKASDGTLAFHALIVARQDAGIASPADLEGKTIAMGASDSVGGRLMQLAGVIGEKIDPQDFGSALELESADDALRAVVRGEADAAFVWSSMSGDAEEGYSRGTLSNLVASGEVSMENIAILWQSPPVAHGPFAVTTSMPDETKGAIAGYLLTLEASRPAAYDMLDPFYGGGYVRVDAQNYSGLAALAAVDFGSARFPPPPAEAGPSE